MLRDGVGFRQTIQIRHLRIADDIAIAVVFLHHDEDVFTCTAGWMAVELTLALAVALLGV